MKIFPRFTIRFSPTVGALVLLAGLAAGGERRQAVEEQWEAGKRWAPGHSFADTAGLVRLTLLLHCSRDETTHKLTPTNQSSNEDRRAIRAYNRGLASVKTFAMPTSSDKISISGYDDVIAILMNAQAFSVKGQGMQANSLLLRAIKSDLIGTDPLGSVIAADLAVREQGDFLWAKGQLKASATAHPANKLLWLCYASKSETGSFPTGSKFNPLAPPFTFGEAVEARKYILKMWPDHHKSLYYLAQDLDFLGRKREARDTLERLEAVHTEDPELISMRTSLRKYFDAGGFKKSG